ncbi:hypothetical protein V6N11_060171 [Hibiscus sabdariffa]|uniref:Uncharacterized protein n=1 Tax=Hibiscus sabdariffa TaxID=183260 RepID=A0ABR2P379_9ROSI
MESLAISSSKSQNPGPTIGNSNPPSTSGTPRPSRPPSLHRSEIERTFSTSHVATLNHGSLSSSGSLESEKVVQLNNHNVSRSESSCCPNLASNTCTGMQYAEAKQSFTNTEVSECASSVEKSGESGEVSNSFDLGESRKTSLYRGSTGSEVSDESSSSFLSSVMYKPHKANDIRWEAI